MTGVDQPDRPATLLRRSPNALLCVCVAVTMSAAAPAQNGRGQGGQLDTRASARRHDVEVSGYDTIGRAARLGFEVTRPVARRERGAGLHERTLDLFDRTAPARLPDSTAVPRVSTTPVPRPPSTVGASGTRDAALVAASGGLALGALFLSYVWSRRRERRSGLRARADA